VGNWHHVVGLDDAGWSELPVVCRPVTKPVGFSFFMSINFEFNERVNQIVASIESLRTGAPIPGIHELLADVIRALDPVPSLEEMEAELDAGRLPEPEWSVHNGPAIYVLTDSTLGHFCPAIVWVCETEHMKRRVNQHLKGGSILFDGVRGVFIEHDRMRLLIERQVLAYFKSPESGHSETIQNRRYRALGAPDSFRRNRRPITHG
jgi:hypothetical protein